MAKIPPTWKIEEEPYLQELLQFVKTERASGVSIYPPDELVFNALIQTPLDQVKVVILGQDPYHQPGQAEGLSFSVPTGTRLPPSLRNIYKELNTDSKDGSLLPWAKQGVLLLNTLLTVQDSTPLSHQKRGWEKLTDNIIEKVLNKKDPVVFLLWGRLARDKVLRLKQDNSPHLFLTSPHPSPLSAHRGFLGNGHFQKANAFLEETGQAPIEWV